jgi:hypothetical protein
MSDPTPYERFKALAKKVVSVPKAEVDKRESVYRQKRAKKRSRGGTA